MLQPEPIPTRAAPGRPQKGRSQGSPQPPTPRLPDFTEDPFSNYRYEDPFTIADPFADEPNEDANANKSTISTRTATTTVDAFGFDTTMRKEQDYFDKTFDSDFSTDFPELGSKKSHRKSNNNKFEADFGTAFSDNNRNPVKATFEADFASNFGKSMGRLDNESISSYKGHEKVKSKASSVDSLTTAFRDHSITDKKSKGKLWNGNGTQQYESIEEQRAIAWAEKQSLQSLQAEEEKRRRKEEEELALAIKLSVKDNSGH